MSISSDAFSDIAFRVGCELMTCAEDTYCKELREALVQYRMDRADAWPTGQFEAVESALCAAVSQQARAYIAAHEMACMAEIIVLRELKEADKDAEAEAE